MSWWRRTWREAGCWMLLALFLGVLGGLGWATRNPDHPALSRAGDWPAVGPLVERFQSYYGVGSGDGSGAGAGPADGVEGAGAGVEGGWGRPRGAEPGPGAAPAPSLPEPPALPEPPGGALPAGPERVWVSAGEEVRESPAASSRLLGRQPAFERLEVLERSGDWARVATPFGEGWVRVAPGEDLQYPRGGGLRATVPLPGARPDARELRAARELLGADRAAGRLGPYDLYTDVEPVSRLFHLDRVAQQAEPVYRRRYGRPLEGEPAEAVLVFAREDLYRLYQTREARLQGLPAGGHSGRGLMAFWVGGRHRHEVAATFLHELGHVLNRRAVGPALPPWLDEGLAEDLSLSEVTPAGELLPERLGGAVVRRGDRIEYQGAVAALRNLNASFARVDPLGLEGLVSLDWEGFVRTDRRALHYAHAGYFVRYLVETPELAEGFRRFLDRVAAGGPATGEALRQELGRPWDQLDAGLAEWVRGKILDSTLEARGDETRAGDSAPDEP